MIKKLPEITSEVITASAGAGKTYDLTDRYLSILGRQYLAGLEIAPEKIVALTFTRKAAGEFYKAIIEKLAEGALQTDKTNKNQHHPVLSLLDHYGYLSILKTVLNSNSNLQLYTLDGFFAKILRTFPNEFGIKADFQIMDEALYKQIQNEVLEKLSARKSGKSHQTERQHLITTFQATLQNKESTKVLESIAQFISNNYEKWLQNPDSKIWANVELIWDEKDKSHISHNGPSDRDITKLEKLWIEDLEDKERLWSEQFFKDLTNRNAGSLSTTEKKVFSIIDKIGLDNFENPTDDHVTFKISRKNVSLEAEGARQLSLVIKKIVGQEIQSSIDKTLGIYGFLTIFDHYYQKQVRSENMLSYQDITNLLSKRSGLAIRKDVIDFRIDAKQDHWLFDEFQDTSVTQWQALKELPYEAASDPSGERSSFFVGDPKQSIYSWRGGESRIFDVLNREFQPLLGARSLDTSWRSSKDVLQFVNLLFSDNKNLEAYHFPSGTITRWECNEHKTAHPDREGITLILENSSKDTNGREKIVKSIINDVDSHGKNTSCAILVDTNKQVTDLAGWLKEEGIETINSSATNPIYDNPCTYAIISLLTYASHPSDGFYKGVFRNSALFKALGRPLNETPTWVRKSIFENSFSTFLIQIESLIEDTLSPFLKHRFDYLYAQAVIFDKSGSKDIDGFLDYLKTKSATVTSKKSNIEILTIHKSKGLTFDYVILPFLKPSQAGQFKRNRNRFYSSKDNKTLETNWFLEMPQEIVAENDEVLSAELEQELAESNYEALCKLYVALTRAKYANYIVFDTPPKRASSRNFEYFIRNTIQSDVQSTEGNGEYTFSNGERATLFWQSNTNRSAIDWPSKLLDKEPHEIQNNKISIDTRTMGPIKRANARTPSGSEELRVKVSNLFQLKKNNAAIYGTLIHDIFELIKWKTELKSEELEDLVHHNFSERNESELLKKAFNEVRGVLDDPNLEEYFIKPANHKVLVWNERRFETILNNDWVSGAFDRIVLHYDSKDRDKLVSAEIIDFKTDSIADQFVLEEKVKGYQPQLVLYQKVLSKMTSLKKEQIKLRILFTNIKKIVSIESI